MYGDADLGHAYDANRLLGLFAAQHVEDATLDLWRNTLNYRIFENKAEAARRLQLVATYSETNASAGPGIKNKLRMLTKVLTDPARTLDPVQLLLTLASHGGVCNIMKEVGIHTAYSLATDTVRDRFECATLDQQVLRALRDLREMLVEEEYKKKAIGRNNAHPLTEYRNYLSADIGLPRTPDPNQVSGWSLYKPLVPSMKDDYWARYSAARIVAHVCEGVNVQPRKIKYTDVVDWCLASSPLTDGVAFLEWVFDEDTGYLREEAAAWMLTQLQVLDDNGDIDSYGPPMDVDTAWDRFEADAVRITGAPLPKQAASAERVSQLLEWLEGPQGGDGSATWKAAVHKARAGAESVTACGEKTSVVRATLCALLTTYNRENLNMEKSSRVQIKLWQSYAKGGVAQVRATTLYNSQCSGDSRVLLLNVKYKVIHLAEN